MKHKSLLFAASALLLTALSGAEAPVIRLWQGDAPLAKGKRECDIPTLTLFLAPNAKAPVPAVLICPGGAYCGLSSWHEGSRYAEFLNANGISAAVLKYRLGSERNGAYRYPVMNLDASRALRTLRANAAKWRIDPARIGIMGSSAGGHLAAMTAVKFNDGDPKSADPVERVSSRPDFAILCYAQTSMDERYGGCAGSKEALIGGTETTEKEVSAWRLVTAKTPPCFIWHTFKDAGVPVRNALDFANALEAQHIPFSLHIYHAGAHGLGLGPKYPKEVHPWAKELLLWLDEIGMLKQTK